MRVISKKIAYNDLTSKLPGIIPSIMNSWSIPSLYSCGKYNNGGETFFSFDLAVKRASEYNINASQLEYEAQFVQFTKDNLIEFTVGNYGLIPSDVIIPENISEKITDYTDIYVNLPISEDKKNDERYNTYYDLSWPVEDEDPHYEGRKIISGESEIKVLTYYTLNKWYSFFKQYYELIHHPNYPRTYESAIDYYKKEIVVKNDVQEAYYKSLDDTFESRGGQEMYDWISSNCIIQYQIPSTFTDEWNTTYLYYPDAIKWYYWFKERSEKYEYVGNTEDCHIVDLKDGNCCDCVEFIRLGGHEFYKGLKEWVDNVNINSDFVTNSASITIPISIINSIDDLGEMTIFSSKWKEEEDYHNTLSTEKNDVGTVMYNPHVKYFRCKQCGYEGPENEFVNNSGTCPKCNYKGVEPFDATLYDTYVIKGGIDKKGYDYNKYYENTVKEDDWLNYTDYYLFNNSSELVEQGITSYTYSPVDGKVVYNPTDDKITKTIEINATKNVCINGNTYDVISGKYVELCYSTNSIANLKYKKHAKLQIFKDGDIEYAILNGKRKYVETDTNDPTKEKIYFLKESNCHDEGCSVSVGDYIVYDSCLYVVDNNKITIYEDDAQIVYPVLDGYFDINDNRLYISGNTVVIQSEPYYYEDTNIYVNKFRELNASELIAFGIKRIEISEDKKHVTLYYRYTKNDCMKVSGRTDSKLDVLRRKEITTDDLGNELPGYFRSIVDIDKGNNPKQSIYNLPYDECTLDILYKVGDVSDLKYIGVDKNKFFGNIITDIKFYYVNEFGNKILEYHALEDDALMAIEDCKEAYEGIENDNIPNIMYCDITYHMGCVIKKQNNKYVLDNSTYKGVKYVDTVYVTKQVGTYYLNEDRYFTFNYYLLSQNIDTINITDFNDSVTWDASTYFEFEPMIHTTDGIHDEEMFSDFEHNNGVIEAPVFRSEFNLASSLPQNVEADIYIDRGISAAYEKLLKLQEVRSIEALENYGNSWFKINEY